MPLADDLEVQWREATMEDLPRISEIANSIHLTLPERPEVFADKMRLSPQTTLVLQGGDTLVGYAFAHPWKRYRIPPLDCLLEELPHDADCLYIHDVVVLPEFRGKRAVKLVVNMISQLAQTKGHRFLALVSVYHTTALWERFGFRAVEGASSLAEKLLSYGNTAKYMICDLDMAFSQ